MPWLSVKIEIYDRALGYVNHRDSFIEECSGDLLTKVLFLRAAKKLLRILIAWNRRKKGLGEMTSTTTSTTTTTTTL